MSRIVAMPDGNFLSHTSRVLEVALELERLGHEVIFAGDGQYLKMAEEHGFAVEYAHTNDPEYTLNCSRSGRVNWWTYERLKEGVAADRSVFESIQPDLVLGDFRLSLATSSELAGLPYAVILNASWTDYYAAKVRAPEHFPFTRIVTRPVATALLPPLKAYVLSVDARPFRKLRKQRGLEPRGNMWDQWRGDINLISDSPTYGPTENLPDNFHYVGPIVWEPNLPAPEWMHEIKSDMPTIYITMGSTGDPRYFDHAADLFGDSDCQCIMTTANLTDRTNFPDNFFVTDYAPGSLMMQKVKNG